MTVKEGDKIKVDYEGSFEDGTIFDSSKKHGNPLVFTVGAKQVIKGFDDAVRGMKVGDDKEITLTPAEGYGDRNPQLVQKVPRKQLPENLDVTKGAMLRMQTPDGQVIPAEVTEVADDEVTIDINHPLAGKTLKFKLTILEIMDSEKSDSIEKSENSDESKEDDSEKSE